MIAFFGKIGVITIKVSILEKRNQFKCFYSLGYCWNPFLLSFFFLKTFSLSFSDIGTLYTPPRTTAFASYPEISRRLPMIETRWKLDGVSVISYVWQIPCHTVITRGNESRCRARVTVANALGICFLILYRFTVHCFLHRLWLFRLRRRATGGDYSRRVCRRARWAYTLAYTYNKLG